MSEAKALTAKAPCGSCQKNQVIGKSMVCQSCIDACLKSFDEVKCDPGIVGYRRLYHAKLLNAQDTTGSSHALLTNLPGVGSGFHIVARIPTSGPADRHSLPMREELEPQVNPLLDFACTHNNRSRCIVLH